MSTKKKMLRKRKPVDDEKMLFDFQIYHAKKHFYAILFMATLQKTVKQIILLKISVRQTHLRIVNKIYKYHQTHKGKFIMVNRFWIELREIMGYLILLKVLSLTIKN